MMRETERRIVNHALALVLAGRRSEAASELRQLGRRPPRRPKPEPEGQAALPLPQPDPYQLRFRCERLDAWMVMAECVQRRGDVWPSGRRKGHPKKRECAGCQQGATNALACPGVELRAPSQAPEVLPEQQRRAKRARALVSLGFDDPVSIDPLREASMMTPEDDSDWRA